jgi:hypothetical protein
MAASPAAGSDGVIVRKSARPVSLGIRTEPAPVVAPVRKGPSQSKAPDSQRKLLIYGTAGAVLLIVVMIVFGGPRAPEAPTTLSKAGNHLNPLGSDPEGTDGGKAVREESDPEESDTSAGKRTKRRSNEPMVEDESEDEPKPKSKTKKTVKTRPAASPKERPEAETRPAIVAPSDTQGKPATEELVRNDPKSPTMTKPATMTKPETGPASETPEGAPDPEQAAAFDKAILKVRTALAGRNVDQAHAELKGAKSLAKTAGQKKDLARVDALVGYVAGFWNAVRESMKGLPPTEELKIGNTVVTVVEADQDGLTLHRPGRNDKYTIANMPGGIAFMLAERWYDKSNPANKIYLGAFHAVDLSGDLGEARRLWDAATKAGASAEDLMPLLDAPPVKLAAVASTAGEDKPEKVEKAAAVKADQAFMKKYGPEWRAAGTPEKKLDLAAKLIEELKLSDDPTEQNTLFRKACELVNRVAVSPATPAEVAREAAKRAMSLIDQAIEEKRLDGVKVLLQGPASVMAARKSQDDDLVKVATEHIKKLQAALKQQGDPSL